MFNFSVTQDPDDDACYSVYLDNGSGASAEVAKGIYYQALANKIALALNGLPQAQVAEIFEFVPQDASAA